MTRPSRPYRPELLKALQDPEEAIEYLNAAIEDGSEQDFLAALRNVAAAREQRDSAAAQAHDGSLDHLLTAGDLPRLSMLSEILRVLGLRLAVEAREALPV
jgi:DNA-binding phage protein